MYSGGQNRNNQNRAVGDVEAQNLVPANAETIKEQRDHVRHLQREAFQLANYYFVFQGVIFTAFYNTPSHLKCEYHWIPFALSFLAGVLNLCALCSIAFKYKTTLDAIDTTVMTTPAAAARDAHAPIGVTCERHWRSFYVVGCLCLFVGFFVITLIGCWVISCGGNTTP